MTNGMTRRAAIAAAALCLGMAWPASHAAAQDTYPNKPVHFVVTFPPGGSADLMARAVAQKVGETLGQTFIVENRPGGGGNIGLEVVAKAAPDGYTIGLGAAGALTVNPTLLKSMPFDPIKDLAPITMLAEIPFVLVAHPSVPAKTLKEVIALGKSKPKSLSIAHGGNGTAMHLSSQLFNSMAGIDAVLVAYKGSGPAAKDAMAGHVPMAMLDIPSSLAFIEDKRLNALAVTSTKRADALPDVPTFAEAGVPGYESVGWFGVVAPAGTSAPIIAKLNAAIVEALKDPGVKERALSMGAIPAPSTPQAFGAFIKSETKKWAKVIAEAGLKVE